MMKRLWIAAKAQWTSYRFRFVPWVALNLKQKPHRSVNHGSDKIVSDSVIIQRLQTLFSALQIDASTTDSLKILEKSFGFRIERKKSNLTGGGTGVFLTRGRAPSGTLIALYPGTIYRVMEPILLPSLSNSFIFRCIDGLHIDGKDRGISRSIYKSCVYRDLRWPYFPADLSWLKGSKTNLINPLNCGQYVNNATPEFECNVAYQECDLNLQDFPIEWRKYLPNIYYSGSDQVNYNNLRIVALIATRDIEENSELFSSYYTIVNT